MVNLRVGDKVQTCVFVCGERVPIGIGTIVELCSGIAKVDIGTIHGAQKWVVWENTGHLTKINESI